MENYTFSVSDEWAEKTVKEYLLGLGFSVTLIKKVKYGGILLNGAPVTVRARLTRGDTVSVVMPREESENIPPIDIPLEILYEAAHMLAVCKPKNMPTHPSRGNSLPTLANAVMARYGGNFVFRAITRLDRDTSGLVLIAKNRLSAYKLSLDMKAGKILKRYTALLSGVPSAEFGVIDAPIRRVAEGEIKRGVFEDGKRAVTEYRVVGVTDGNALAGITLHTGRTHQIRVHAAYIGHPLVGDFLYGERGEDGYFLRCCELKFNHPKSGKEIHLRI